MKIGLVCFSLAGGGVERIALNLAKYFQNHKKYSAEIILIKNIKDYKSKKISYGKIKVIPLLNTQTKIPKFLYPFKTIEIIVKLLLLAKKKEYKILIGFAEYYPYYLSIIITQLIGIKNILRLGNNLSEDLMKFNYFLRLFHQLCLKISFSATDKIISVSHGVTNDLVEKFHVPDDKITTIYNGLDLVEINILKKANNDNMNYWKKNLIICMGRLVTQKGHEFLIRAFYQVKQHLPNYKLLIIGKGPLRQKLLSLVSKLELQGDVLLLGFVDNPYKYLHKAKLFVLPSLYEGFGNVLLEALACGLPVISTDCHYGPREILLEKKIDYQTGPIKGIMYGKYGVLIRDFGNRFEISKNEIPQKEKLLANTMINLLRNINLLSEYQRFGYRRVKSFTLKKMGQSYLRVINNLLGE